MHGAVPGVRQSRRALEPIVHFRVCTSNLGEKVAVSRETATLLAHRSLTGLEHRVFWLRKCGRSSFSRKERGPSRVWIDSRTHLLAVVLWGVDQLRLMLVPHILHLVLIREQNRWHSFPVSLNLSLITEGCLPL